MITISTLRDSFRGRALLLFMFLPSLNYFLNYILQVGIGYNASISIVTYALLSVLGLLCLVRYGLTYKNRFFFYFLVMLCVIVSFILYPAVRETLTENIFNPVYSKIYVIFIYCLPLLFLALSLDEFDFSFIELSITYYAASVVIVGIIAYMFSVINGTKIEYMTFSYNLLMASEVCIISKRFNQKIKFGNFFRGLGIVSTICILLSGARGALVAALLFFVILPSSENNRKIVKYILLLVAVVILLFDFSGIIKAMTGIAEMFGITRLHALDALTSNSFFTDNGRSQRIEGVISGIKSFPIGYGLFGDWYCINKYCGYVSYVHNFIFEALADFGIIGGIVFISYTISRIYRGLKSPQRCLIAVLIPVGFIQLMFSGSFLSETLFYCLLGIAINQRYAEFAYE